MEKWQVRQMGGWKNRRLEEWEVSAWEERVGVREEFKDGRYSETWGERKMGNTS